jgi:hypothetical protein
MREHESFRLNNRLTRDSHFVIKRLIERVLRRDQARDTGSSREPNLTNRLANARKQKIGREVATANNNRERKGVAVARVVATERD